MEGMGKTGMAKARPEVRPPPPSITAVMLIRLEVQTLLVVPKAGQRLEEKSRRSVGKVVRRRAAKAMRQRAVKVVSRQAAKVEVRRAVRQNLEARREPEGKVPKVVFQQEARTACPWAAKLPWLVQGLWRDNPPGVRWLPVRIEMQTESVMMRTFYAMWMGSH